MKKSLTPFAFSVLLKTCIIVFALLLQSSLFGQIWMDNEIKKGKEPNFFNIQKDFIESYNAQYPKSKEENNDGNNKEIKTKKKKTPGGFKAYKRWEYYWAARVNPDGTFPPAGANIDAFKVYTESKNLKSKGASQPSVLSGNWTSLGPNSTPGGYAGIGRINSIGFDPGNPNIIYAGAAGGGLWKSTNGGTSWTTTTDALATLGVSGIAVVPSTPSTIFIATGDGDAGDNYSVGVLKSTDGGTTWNTTGYSVGSSTGRLIRRLLIDPNDENTMLIATNNGIYRTINGSVTWTQVVAGNFYDIEANPNASTNIFYACTANALYKSSDNGATWTNVQTISGSNRIALGVSAANSAVVYALSSKSSGSGFNGLFKSTDSGATYGTQSTTPNVLGYDTDGGDANGQGWYDLVVAIDPANENIVYTGGVNNWKSIDGGVTWVLNSFWYSISGVPAVHADKHALEWNNGTLYQGTDGGLYKTTNGGPNWSSISGNMVISQMYRLGLSKTDSKAICGLQDNGTKLRSTTGVWSDHIGGDGFEAAIDPVNSNTMYGEVYYGAIQRSTNNGGSWSNIVSGLSGSAAWITPFVIDPLVNTTLYIGYSKVFKTTNQGTNWSAISPDFGIGTLGYVNVAPSNTNYIYAGNSGSLRRTIDGGANWSSMTVPGGGTNMIAISPLDPNILWAVRQNYTAGAKVYKSINGGSTWTNISGTLPNIPANAIVYAPCSQDGLYIGMDVGIFYRDNTLGDWVLFNSGLPNAEIFELEIDVPESAIYAATYGRGLWKSDLYDSAPLIGFTTGTATGPTTCLGSDGSIVLNFTNVPDGSYTISYKKNGSPATMVRTVTGNTTTLTGLGAGSYTEFSITANNCVGTNSGPVTLSDPTPPTVNPIANQSICSGEMVVAVNFTGTAGANFAWTNDNTNIGLAASGSGNISGYTAPTVATTQTGNLTVTPSKNGCTGTAQNFTITVKPLPVLGISSFTQPTCGNNNGSITFNFTNVANGSYTINYTLNSIPGAGPITISGGVGTLSGLGQGTYNNFSLTANGCTGTLTSSVILDCGGPIGDCPIISSLSVSNSIECKTGTITLTAGGLSNMGAIYGINFISSLTPLADPYVGGTLLGTVNNGSLTGGGSQAVLTTIIPTVGSYYLYAIVTPLPTDPACRPSKSTTVKIIDCTPVISIPCACKNNASTLTDGQFNETVSVNAPAGQTWTVTAVTGLFQTSSPAPPSAPIAIPTGFVLTQGTALPDGSANYTLMGVHVDAIGYSVSIGNGLGASGTLASTCYYPNPQINGLAATYCANDPAVTLNGSATLGGPPGGVATGTGTFTINGIPNTIFNPAAGAGTYTVVYSFDATDGVPNASHPGCTQTVSQSVLVNPVPTVNAVSSLSYCVGTTVPASNFSGTPAGVVYNWSRTAGAIGLAPLSGTGNVPSFVATNAGTTPISSTFTVTPSYTAGGKTCSGTPINYTITVNPSPSVNNPGNKVYCSGQSTGGITFTGTATSFNWTNTNTQIGLAASGTASPTIPSWVAVNNTNVPIVGTITVTPIYTSGGITCTGSAISFTITISPAPKAICKNAKIFLNAAGQATLNSADIDGGSYGGTVSISKSSFDCSNIGSNSVSLTVTDACNFKSTCTAVVEVVDNIPPVLGAIPADLFLECSDAIPAATVVTATDNCSATVSMVETSNKTNYPSQCSSISYDITRIWTATDPSGNKVSKSQKISLKDTKAPSFTIVPPAFITVECDDDNANNINPYAVDGCDGTPSMLLDIQYDFNKNGCPNSYLATYTWTVGDKCGNTAEYVQKITVRDTTPPVIACPANIEIVSSVDVPVSWAVPKTKDNCGGNIAIVQIAGPPSGSIFEPNSITTITYICKDQCGNSSKCSFTVSVKKAGTKTGNNISGNVTDDKSPNHPIAAEVQLSGSVNQFSETNGGAYSFLDIPNGANVSVNAEQLKYPLNGVNSLDLVYITNHILGKKALNSPYKMLAADVNHSSSVTTADLVEIRKLILHITDQFQNAKSWEFITAPDKFSNPNNPWLDVISQNAVVNDILGDKTVDFIGYKMGDVTDDANPNSLIADNDVRSAETLQLYAKDQNFVAGDEIEVGINGQDLALLKALQFTLNFNKEALDFVSINTKQSNMSADNFGLRFLNDGKITTSMDWSNPSNNNELCTIIFKAKTNGSLKNTLTIGSSLTTAKAFDISEKSMEVDLSYNNQNGQVLKSNPILYQNEPNPFETNTVINFYLPEASHATISIYNIAGNLIKEIAGSYPRGENKIVLDKKDLPAAGIYLYKLNNAGFTDIKKMILVK